MRILVDANIALRFVIADDPRYPQMIATIGTLIDAGHELLYTPQVMREMYHTCMRPRESNGYAFSIQDARGALALIEASDLVFLDDSPGVYAAWRRLIETIEIRGRQTHDANHAADLIAHPVTHLLTLDRRDFARYPGVSVLSPEDAHAL